MIKIAYCIYSMSNPAGMERALSARVNFLCDTFDITIITQAQRGEKFAFPLDERIHKIDLGLDQLPNKKPSHVKKACKQALTEVLFKEKFNVVVSLGGIELSFLHSILDGSKKVADFRFSYDIYKVFVKDKRQGIIGDILVQLHTWYRDYHARKYDRVVVLSKADKKKWETKGRCKNVDYIYNPLTITPDSTSTCENKTVVAVGRLEFQKGFDFLIDAWVTVNKKHPDWKLEIWGEGSKRETLQNQIQKNNLQDVITLCGKTDNVTEKYLSSSIFVLSSRDEAFGLVITEAESCGLPVVTFACPSAPAELVDHNKNGFVIERLGDIESMSKYISLLIEDEQLRKSMGKESAILAQRYYVKNIKPQWISFFNKVLEK